MERTSSRCPDSRSELKSPVLGWEELEKNSWSKLNPLFMLGPSPWIIKHAVLFMQQGAQGVRGEDGDPGETGLTVSTRQLTRSSTR